MPPPPPRAAMQRCCSLARWARVAASAAWLPDSPSSLKRIKVQSRRAAKQSREINLDVRAEGPGELHARPSRGMWTVPLTSAAVPCRGCEAGGSRSAFASVPPVMPLRAMLKSLRDSDETTSLHGGTRGRYVGLSKFLVSESRYRVLYSNARVPLRGNFSLNPASCAEQPCSAPLLSVRQSTLPVNKTPRKGVGWTVVGQSRRPREPECKLGTPRHRASAKVGMRRHHVQSGPPDGVHTPYAARRHHGGTRRALGTPRPAPPWPLR